ncbi:regulator of nonsense transcripts 3B isoform X2 [Homo sapiens]|uniref:regulator of nonsense transcripts 3B isoform X2 n=1 Tax=Homo sapiens TaxID=9606 RepID=UPI0007DC4EA0|nr:regulator of nonsense transcripts 3B isoform X2 [Homo sapiens]XP_047298331.1 regulator of nonsense transcripts 3B isoform X2 [Homo sapiens]XP_054183570.1 regulator of nonsense transcripts 3B isoform X2 [Homo sapiens]XP_054183571.1 regulator of nonsense transcripts 3B isoform X2 [Homo sapiens]|eukprot:XP_016885227.1 regulator of nonsense transcripts 3B isoform X2 [Homo sapiens]
MKEEKEHRPKEKRVTLLTPAGATGSGGGTSGDSSKGEDKQDRNKEKKEALSKVVIRRLPPTLTKEQLQEHLQPMPEHDYFEFFSNDTSLYPHMYARAYINFKNQEDIILFRDRFDGYVFLDNKGQEYPAIVEFAPFQKAAKKKTKKRDTKVGTIDDDPEYRKFLESYATDNEKMTSTPETLLEEIEAKNRELIAKKTTPLLSFLKNKQRMREEKREERRRREIERKRQREEERRKWKEEEKRKRKDIEKLKKIDRIPERDKLKDEPKIKVHRFLLQAVNQKNLLKKPEKGDEKELDKREKAKKLDKENLSDERASGQSCTLPKRSDSELKDEKPKRPEDESGRDYREREREYERDQERILRERERLKRQEEERRRQKERYEKEKTFKRKEEEMKKEKDTLRDKGKKAESTESIGSSEKTEKKEEVVKRDRIRNKDRPAMQLYQPGARSRNRLCPPDDSTKSGDSAAERKQGRPGMQSYHPGVQSHYQHYFPDDSTNYRYSPVEEKQESSISCRKEGGGQAWWRTPVIPALWEAEAGRSHEDCPWMQCYHRGARGRGRLWHPDDKSGDSAVERKQNHPGMQRYHPGARSQGRLSHPDDITKSGDSAVERKQDHPGMKLYHPGARSPGRFWWQDGSTNLEIQQ